ncbi:14-3-3epsilon, partial [Dactylonectria estremocensis]
VIPTATTGQSKVLYYKMYIYLLIFLPQSPRSPELTYHILTYYLQIATDIAQIELAATHPSRLGVALNFSDFYYEIQNSPNRAYHLAKMAVHYAIAELDSLSEGPFGDCMFTMQTPLWESDDLGVFGD